MKTKTILFTTAILLNLSTAIAQVKKQLYKDCEVCNSWAIHKGKKLHGQKYCDGYMMVRKYHNGKIDTLGWSLGGSTWMGNTYDMYSKLSERNKYIVDSLKEDGISQLQQSYLTYEPIYMKAGRKLETFWDIQGISVVVIRYALFNGKRGTGFSLVSENTLK